MRGSLKFYYLRTGCVSRSLKVYYLRKGCVRRCFEVELSEFERNQLKFIQSLFRVNKPRRVTKQKCAKQLFFVLRGESH